MNHSYEEIQNITIEILQNNGWMKSINQYASLQYKISQQFSDRDRYFSRENGEIFREV